MSTVVPFRPLIQKSGGSHRCTTVRTETSGLCPGMLEQLRDHLDYFCPVCGSYYSELPEGPMSTGCELVVLKKRGVDE